MEILTVVKSVLENAAAVTAKRTGGIWINQVGQNEPRPNLMLMLVSGGQDYTHQGPTQFFDALVRIYARGDTDREAAQLGRTVQDTLENWTGTVYGHTVSLCQHINTNGDYQDAAKVYRQIDDFRLFYRRT